MKRPLRWSAALLLALLTGCSSRGPVVQGDHGPARPPRDLSAVPDAVPRNVPPGRYGNPDQYTVLGKTYRVLRDARGFRQRGIASWYGLKFHGRRTSSGELYDMYAMTAAHKTLPLPSWVRVTNLDNGRQVVVKVNDRGPFHPGRIIDLSYTAAWKLGMLQRGTAPVEIEVVTADDPASTPTPTRGPRIQVGAFASKTNARSLARRLQRRLQIPVQVLHEGRLYRVLAAPRTPEARQALQQTLIEWGLRLAAGRTQAGTAAIAGRRSDFP